MAAGTAKWATWLPMVAAGAVAAYAITKRREASADSAWNWRHCGPRFGCASPARWARGYSRRGGGDRQQTAHRSVSLLAKLENLPRFMNHLRAVSQREAGISHWVARGPAGMNVEWDARIINEIDGRLIAWQSLEGSGGLDRRLRQLS